MNRKTITSIVLVSVLSLSFFIAAVSEVMAGIPTTTFSITLLAPINNSACVQSAQLIAFEMLKIGIGVNLQLVGWDVLTRRVFEPLGPLALSYADGGYDMVCLEGSADLLPTTQYQLFHSSFTPDPNYFGLWNKTLDEILELTVNTTDIGQRKQYIHDAWQYLTWSLQPEITLYQVEHCVYMRDNVKGYSNNVRVPGPLGLAEMYFENGQSQGHGQRNDFIMASTTRPTEFNDVIENDWYNQRAIAPLNHGMVERDPDYDFTPVLLTKLPEPVAVVNNHTGILSSTDPNWATVWEIELRDDIYWHEGYGYTMAADEDTLRVDADDVLFTFDFILDDNGPSPCIARPDWQRLLGNEISLAIIKKDRNHVQFHLQTRDADLLTYFGQPLFPQHILALGTIRADDSMASTDYIGWKTDDWNLGHRTGGYTGPAVIGNGPYLLWPGEDSSAKTVTETKNPYWYLRNEPQYVNMFNKYIYTWISSKDTALNALEQAEIDLMDLQFHAEKDFSILKNKPGIFVQKILDWGCQTVGINIAHGAGGLDDYRVRLAISHIVPRQDMVDYLLGGLGQPAFIHFPKQSPFYPDNIEPIRYNYTKALSLMDEAGYGWFWPTWRPPPPTTNSYFETWISFTVLYGIVLVAIWKKKRRSQKALK
ncbi:MAG: ABC transporter substrate-binding protein [Candidatus Hermodarchaeota archaeon]